MYIHCTKKVIDLGELTISEIEEHEPLFSWYVNILKVNRRNFMVAINEKTGYPLFFYGIKKKDLRILQFNLELAIEFALKREGYPIEYIFNYLEQGNQCHIHKTASRKILGHLNEVTNEALYLDRWEIVEDCINVSSISTEVSSLIMNLSKGGIIPREEMLKELKDLYLNTNKEVS